MIYGRIEPHSILDLEALLLVQEAQFEKYMQDLGTSSISVNVAQGPSNQNNQGDGNSNRGRGLWPWL